MIMSQSCHLPCGQAPHMSSIAGLVLCSAQHPWWWRWHLRVVGRCFAGCSYLHTHLVVACDRPPRCNQHHDGTAELTTLNAKSTRDCCSGIKTIITSICSVCISINIFIYIRQQQGHHQKKREHDTELLQMRTHKHWLQWSTRYLLRCGSAG